MHDWFVAVLVSIREMAAKSGMVALAEEMDVAILVAAEESHGRDSFSDPHLLDHPAQHGQIFPGQFGKEWHLLQELLIHTAALLPNQNRPVKRPYATTSQPLCLYSLCSGRKENSSRI